MLLRFPCSHRLALSSMHCVLCVVSYYICLSAHIGPRHQCNESLVTGVLSSDPTQSLRISDQLLCDLTLENATQSIHCV